MADKLLSIVVLSWNRLQYAKTTIDNIIKLTKVPHILTLVDNNSTDESGVRDYLNGITTANTNATQVLHVFNDRNLGVSGGRNSGIHAVEQLGLEPQYLFNVDDDVLLPDQYDRLMIEACDRVPKLGITGVNVEPVNYPLININGAQVQHKQLGNLGGAALCLPRRVFKRVGYYGFGKCTQYGHEDSAMRSKLDILGLASYYIAPRGVHLDVDADPVYRAAKNDAHVRGSIQMAELSRAVGEMRKTGNIYTSYVPPEQYHPVDEALFTNELMTHKDNK